MASITITINAGVLGQFTSTKNISQADLGRFLNAYKVQMGDISEGDPPVDRKPTNPEAAAHWIDTTFRNIARNTRRIEAEQAAADIQDIGMA